MQKQEFWKDHFQGVLQCIVLGIFTVVGLSLAGCNEYYVHSWQIEYYDLNNQNPKAFHDAREEVGREAIRKIPKCIHLIHFCEAGLIWRSITEDVNIYLNLDDLFAKKIISEDRYYYNDGSHRRSRTRNYDVMPDDVFYRFQAYRPQWQRWDPAVTVDPPITVRLIGIHSNRPSQDTTVYVDVRGLPVLEETPIFIFHLEDWEVPDDLSTDYVLSDLNLPKDEYLRH